MLALAVEQVHEARVDRARLRQQTDDSLEHILELEGRPDRRNDLVEEPLFDSRRSGFGAMPDSKPLPRNHGLARAGVQAGKWLEQRSAVDPQDVPRDEGRQRAEQVDAAGGDLVRLPEPVEERSRADVGFLLGRRCAERDGVGRPG